MAKQVYCLKCKKKVPFKAQPALHKMRNGCTRASGKCGRCGCGVSALISKKDQEGGNLLFDIADLAPDALPMVGLIHGLLK